MVFCETDDSRFGLIGPEAIMVFCETDDSRFGLIGPEAIMVFCETDDSRFGLIGPEAIMVWHRDLAFWRNGNGAFARAASAMTAYALLRHQAPVR